MKQIALFLGAASAAVYSFGPIPDGETCGHAPDNCGPTSSCGGPFTNLDEWILDYDEGAFDEADRDREVYGEDDFTYFYDDWAAAPFHRYICLQDSHCA